MKILTYTCTLAAAVAILGGIILACSDGLPGWLLVGEVALFSALAMAFGFTAYAPSVPAWLWLRPVRGAVCICLGVGAMYIPPQFIVSAVFLGLGTRLVWQSASELAGPPVRDRITVRGTDGREIVRVGASAPAERRRH